MTKLSNHIPRLELVIPLGTIKKYTTLLQAGIFVESISTTTIFDFLSSLPGFTSQYIRERIETIFLNGQPVDDLEAQIGGPAPVLAVSAAMPGLAGAIFRKNSFHAPLRTSAATSSATSPTCSEKAMVMVKFFNVIAVERGETILLNGCLVKSDSILKFIGYRPQLFSAVLSISCDDTSLSPDDVENIFQTSEIVFLKIKQDSQSV